MKERRFLRLRLGLTALATLAELASLAWQHLHGGIASHHILDRADLPAISNGWGGLVVPVLAWFLLGRIQKRMTGGNVGQAAPNVHARIAVGFVLALAFGIAIAVAFTSGHDSATNAVFGAMIVLALLLPGYRAECVLGFVLGMMLTFGAVLPTAVACIVAAASAAVHLGIRPLLARLWARVGRRQSPVA